MKKFLIILGVIVLVIVVTLGGAFWAIFGGMQSPGKGPTLPQGIEQVADGFTTIFMLDVGDGKIALVDAGNDDSGAPVLEALKRRGKTLADVSAIFITHAHPDHDACVNVFKGAEVFAMQSEVEIAAGKEPYGNFISKIIGAYNPHPFKVTRPLHDGETVTVGDTSVTAYEVSGHTPGSTIYLAKGVLFTGDTFNLTRKQEVEGPVKIFSRDVPQAIESLKGFMKKIEPRASEVKFIATAHTGNVDGQDGLRMLRTFLATQ